MILLNVTETTLEDPLVSEREQIVSDETAQLVSKVLKFGVAPAIGLIGITWNVLTIVVLKIHGFQKCSNILLVCLAFMDTCFLIGYNSIPGLLYTIHGGGKFLFSEHVSRFLYGMYFVFIVMDYGLGLAALTIPMLITTERLIVVFLPLKANSIITPRRTWLVVACVVLFWVVTIGYTCFWYNFDYIFDQTLNSSVGIIAKSDLYYKDSPNIGIFQEIFFSMKLPPLYTVIGCVAIIIKVKMASVKRQKMTSKTSSTSRTTKTLLAVCTAYLLTCIIIAVPSYLPKEISAYSLTTDNPTNVGLIIYDLMNIWIEINSSWNFLVYIAFNKKFRDIFKELITKGCQQAE